MLLVWLYLFFVFTVDFVDFQRATKYVDQASEYQSADLSVCALQYISHAECH